MKTETKHIRKPIRIYRSDVYESYIGTKCMDGTAANNYIGKIQNPDHAEFIVRAYNCHDELVKACYAAY